MFETTQPAPTGSLRALTSLATWGALWRSGRCAPDDIVDALSDAADSHRITAADPAAAQALSLGAAETGTGSLLRMIRNSRCIRLLMPSPGDTCGIVASPALRSALDTGEILALWPTTVESDSDDAYGLVARTVAADTVTWTAHHLGRVVPAPVESLASVEYDLRQGIRSAAELFTALGSMDAPTAAADAPDLRTRLTELTARSHIDLPPHTSERVIRVIDQATQVAAIVDLVLERTPAFGVTSGAQSSGDHAVERLRALTRMARMTAVNTIISESEQSLH